MIHTTTLLKLTLQTCSSHFPNSHLSLVVDKPRLFLPTITYVEVILANRLLPFPYVTFIIGLFTSYALSFYISSPLFKLSWQIGSSHFPNKRHWPVHKQATPSFHRRLPGIGGGKADVILNCVSLASSQSTPTLQRRLPGIGGSWVGVGGAYLPS